MTSAPGTPQSRTAREVVDLLDAARGHARELVEAIRQGEDLLASPYSGAPGVAAQVEGILRRNRERLRLAEAAVGRILDALGGGSVVPPAGGAGLQ